MKLYSTNNKELTFSLRQAVMDGLAPDGGLYMPAKVPSFPKKYWDDFYHKSFKVICKDVCKLLLSDDLTEVQISNIIEKSIFFTAPLVELTTDKYALELFHGPSLAFKDFGAQFMAQLMSFYNQEATSELVILVATSGDTGGAVAAGFHKIPGIQVVILYPKDKVSDLQARQLTTLGDNISAIEIDGTFDHCQRLVKKAFVDPAINKKIRLTSANSINIARLIPQSFYYFEAIKQLGPKPNPIVVSVPSGNFGNLTAGLMAKRMGLPIHRFVASTNINDIVPVYLDEGRYEPKTSRETISNAMDVGDPSNFIRMQHLYGSTWNDLKKDIIGYSFTDSSTIEAIHTVYKNYGYILDPHAAVAYLGLDKYMHQHPACGIFLGTAHYSKFKSTIDKAIGTTTILHPSLQKLANKATHFHQLSHAYEDFQAHLIKRFC